MIGAVEGVDVVALDADVLDYPGTPAEWPVRAGAFCVDVLLPAGLVAVLALTALSAPEGGWAWWTGLILAAALSVATALNRWLVPSMFGNSLGRSLFGCRVVDRDGGQAGPLRLIARDAAHLLDTVPLLLGWLWPLIDSRGRTFADLLARTEVHTAEVAAAGRRRWAARAAAVITALAVLVAALGVVLIALHQRAVANTRAQIQNTGPALVSDMLSYTAAEVEKDFEHDRTLVTDGYREELVKQQDAVRKAPVDNEYWVTNKAVLEATPNSAAMLLLLQGQRGVAPQQRFITASVRVSFEKVAGDWKIANLTVLTPPKLPDPPADQKPPPPKPKAGATPAPKPAPKSAPKPAPAPEQKGPGR